jgi:tetratricopeptide (TPR) repeat protein
MTQLNAFVGHSFVSEDHDVVEAFLKFLNQVKSMGIGFSWESAEPAEPKELAAKVKGLIQDKNLFIGICTRKEAAIEATRLSKSTFNRKLLKAKEEHFAWKTSDWIIQEIGLAIGRGMDLILLVESGLRQPGGLQGNLEYIPFERSAPEKSFGKLLEMIRALLPKAKPVPLPEAEIRAESEEKPTLDEKKDAEWLEPKEDWNRENYESAVLHMIAMGNNDGERRITEAYFATKEGQIPANRENWEARGEHIRIVFGDGGKLSRLEELAAKYPDNSEVQRYLGMGYRHYDEHEKAGECFLIAAEKAEDKRKELARHGDAVVGFARAGRKERAQETIRKMKGLVPQAQDGEVILINSLRQVADIENNRDVLFGLTERLLQFRPDDVESRFSLAYKYSQADQNELSLFHYLKIPYPNRAAGTWNNLGVQFDHCDLPSKSVGAYRTAEGLGETLAMSNLAQKLIKAGFLKEADEICNRAIKTKDYHKNVGQAISRIKAIPDEERNKEKQVLDKAKPLSEFYRDYGRAAAQNDMAEVSGRWRGPDCEVLITIKANTFLAEGEYELTRSDSTLVGLLTFGKPPQMDKYHVKYSGEIYGHTVKCTVVRQNVAHPTPSTLLGQMANQKQALMIASETLREIRVYEKDSAEKGLFYKLTRLE